MHKYDSQARDCLHLMCFFVHHSVNFSQKRNQQYGIVAESFYLHRVFSPLQDSNTGQANQTD